MSECAEGGGVAIADLGQRFMGEVNLGMRTWVREPGYATGYRGPAQRERGKADWSTRSAQVIIALRDTGEV